MDNTYSDLEALTALYNMVNSHEEHNDYLEAIAKEAAEYYND